MLIEFDCVESAEGSNLAAAVKAKAGGRGKGVKRWIEVIDQYDFKLDYVKGEYNKVADALSGKADYLVALISEFGLSEDVTRSLGEAYKEDPITMDMTNKLQAKDKATSNEFVMVDGLLFLEKAGFKIGVPGPAAEQYIREEVDGTGIHQKQPALAEQQQQKQSPKQLEHEGARRQQESRVGLGDMEVGQQQQQSGSEAARGKSGKERMPVVREEITNNPQLEQECARKQQESQVGVGDMEVDAGPKGEGKLAHEEGLTKGSLLGGLPKDTDPFQAAFDSEPMEVDPLSGNVSSSPEGLVRKGNPDGNEEGAPPLHLPTEQKLVAIADWLVGNLKAKHGPLTDEFWDKTYLELFPVLDTSSSLKHVLETVCKVERGGRKHGTDRRQSSNHSFRRFLDVFDSLLQSLTAWRVLRVATSPQQLRLRQVVAARAESGTTMKPSSARHPQTDGQTERAHQTAQMMLRTLIRPDQKDWVDRLPNIEFAYNTSVHPAIGVTPFELHHGGRKGRIFADLLLPRPADIDAACSPSSFRKYRELLTQARANMQKAQVRMQQQANRRRVPCPIRAGDLVWVSAEKFALEQDVSRKLIPKWFGPLSVTAAAGDEPDGPSFVINIPEHLTVHPVFHASKLATYTPAKSDDFPDRRSQDPPSMDGHQEVDRVISNRKYDSKSRQHKVTFKACDRDDTRWISGADLKASAPLIYAHYEKRRLAQEASRPAPPTQTVVPPSDRQLRPRSPGLKVSIVVLDWSLVRSLEKSIVAAGGQVPGLQ
ncbi:hypothetical protein CBR_g45780 [Chara braunii]|uniref:Integrase catalytic domain-containing protein n=1 Tax=Chara braunii TaxID=69332 RepID=A0A388LZ80_CHABU|nr:hypothetical protein CBR_g45780 [Chara braunii]|eukprot:GBG87628.1 hypothetical protein CBR_g45780 [Chara braunii]